MFGFSFTNVGKGDFEEKFFSKREKDKENVGNILLLSVGSIRFIFNFPFDEAKSAWAFVYVFDPFFIISS